MARALLGAVGLLETGLAMGPGTVLTSLVNDRAYPQPLYGENNRPDKMPRAPPLRRAARHLNFAGISAAAAI